MFETALSLSCVCTAPHLLFSRSRDWSAPCVCSHTGSGKLVQICCDLWVIHHYLLPATSYLTASLPLCAVRWRDDTQQGLFQPSSPSPRTLPLPPNSLCAPLITTTILCSSLVTFSPFITRFILLLLALSLSLLQLYLSHIHTESSSTLAEDNLELYTHLSPEYVKWSRGVLCVYVHVCVCPDIVGFGQVRAQSACPFIC